MTVETDVVSIEDKCGSGQDLVTPDCNGNGGDPDNSYVFVSETDGLGDDHVETKGSESVIEVQAVVGGENGELDVSGSEKEVRVENVGVTDDVKVVNEVEKLPGDGLEGEGGEIEECGVSDVENGEKVVETESDRVGSSVETEREVVTKKNGNLESVEGLNDVIESSVGAGDHQGEILQDEVKGDGEEAKVETGSVESGDHQDGILHDQAKNDVEEATNETGTLENGDHQDTILHDEAKSDVEHIKDEIGTLETSDHQDGVLQDEAKSDVNQSGDDVEQAINEIGTLENGDLQDKVLPDEAKSDVEQIKDETGTLESSDHQDGVLQDEAKSDVNLAKDDIGTLESGGHQDEVLQDEAKSDVNQAKDDIGALESSDHHDEVLQDEVKSDINQTKDDIGALESSDHQDVVLQDEVKSDINQTKDDIGALESSDHQDVVLQDEVKSDINQTKDDIGALESSDHQDVVLQDEGKNEAEQTKDEIGTLESTDHQDGILQDEAKSDVNQAKDDIGTLEGLEGSESRVVADPNLNLDNVTEIEVEKLPGDGLEGHGGKIEECGVSDVDSVEKVVETESDRVGSSVETEREEVVTQQNGNLESVEGLNDVLESSMSAVSDGEEAKSDVNQAKDDIGALKRSEGSESGVVADPNLNLDNVTENEIERVEDTTERTVSSITEEIREGDHENGISQDEAKSDIEQTQDANGSLESLDVSESDVVAVPNDTVQTVDENEIKQVEDHSETVKFLGEAEIDRVSNQPEKLELVQKSEIGELEDPNERLNSLGVAESEMVSEQNEKIEHGAEIEIKEVEDVNELSESSARAETEKVVDRENEIVADSGKVADRKNDGESEMVADYKNDGAAEAETVTDKTNESAVETEKVAAESNNVVDQKNDCESETETGADHKNKGVVETETVTVTDEMSESVVLCEKETAQTNEVAVETENVTDQTNKGVAEIESQKFEDHIVPESSAAPTDKQESQVQDRELFNEPGNENGESGILKESESVVEDPNQSKFEELSSKEQSEIKLAETVNDEIPPATMMVTDIGVQPVDSNVESLEEQENVAPVSDATENRKYETASFIQGDPQEVVEIETIEGGDDKQVETVCEVPEETIENNISVSHEEDKAQNDEEPEKPLGVNSVSSELAQTEEIEASVPAQSFTASYADKSCSDIEVPGAETASVSPLDSPKPQIAERDPSSCESSISGMGTINDAASESNSVPGKTVSAEMEQLVNGGVHLESDVSNVKPEIVSNQPDSVDVKSESGSNHVPETAGVEETESQLESPKATTEVTLSLQENKDDENSESDGVSGASKEDSSTGAIIENETSIAAVTAPFNYIMRVPRFNDESLKERIRQAKLQVEEKTKLRDAIQSQIQQIRANGQIHGVDYEYAKGEIRNARKLVRAKRVEIDSLHSVINKAKNALSIDDIDNRIYSMEHMMQHETLPLKEEKQFIREIKQLKSLRDELSSNMGSDDEIKQALEQREEAEERLKTLRKDLEKLKGDVQKAESAAMEAERKYEDENKKVKELQVQFRAANDVRQEAYMRWLGLRKDLTEKNKYFFKYKDDTAAANNYAFRRDKESLYRLCTDQVEQLMELWNTNGDFRKEYVSFNIRSTVRRFGTLDGRALSPDEEPPILPNYIDERVHRFVSTPTNVDLVSRSVVQLKSEAIVEKGTVNDKHVKKITENGNEKVKSKKAAEPVLASSLPTAESLQAPDEVMDEPVKSKEEIELDRKAEEMRKKEDEAKLKEERRLEGLAKANEARERKKRQAEKMQMRAELKARKEAEEKEKEREKRLRKKEKKKETDSNDGNNTSDSTPSSESAIAISREIDTKDIASVVAKKPQKAAKSSTKKVSTIPAHIRNRNKKKWQNYAYVTVAGILVLVLFWVGNVSLFTDKSFKKPNPFH